MVWFKILEPLYQYWKLMSDRLHLYINNVGVQKCGPPSYGEAYINIYTLYMYIIHKR